MNDLSLYAVAFIDSANTRRVVVLHASDEPDAIYCVSEGWGEVKEAKVTLLDMRVGLMVTVYEEGE